ncbi:mechanosensitive ion channel family protein [Aquimarina agarivorans]|uniref:mechanosensitive ion channel family protein n=1 Tax=Aquimarina agarivorans TaxID=980584 RepID=UPI000248FD72|nr:mechanosensitive ion channel domain-containing protein [Aquimarina agarivorans]
MILNLGKINFTLILQQKIAEKVVDTLDENVWQKVREILIFKLELGAFKISILSLLIVIVTFIITRYALGLITKLITGRLEKDNVPKFQSLLSFIKYFIYALVGVVVFQMLGINLTPILAASAALLVGVGLALQTLFQDILSGVFILIDRTVIVGDIIELDNKIGRVEEIKLRTTRAVTIDNKVLIIPNHQYLTNSLYNWTQNGKSTRDAVTVGVAYDSDVELVKKLLLQAVNENESVLQFPEPIVFFEDFGDSALNFKVMYTIGNSFTGATPRSEIRFTITKLFREYNIQIPFPQREVRVFQDQGTNKI